MDALNKELEECESNSSQGKINADQARTDINNIFRGAAPWARTITISDEFQKFLYVKARGAYMEARTLVVKGGGKCPISKFKFNPSSWVQTTKFTIQLFLNASVGIENSWTRPSKRTPQFE